MVTQKGNMLIGIIICILIVLMSIGAYFLGVKKIKTSKPQPGQQSNIDSPSENLTVFEAVKVEEINWKSYNHEVFSIKYPGNFYLKTTGQTSDFIGDSQQSVESSLNGQSMTPGQILITLMTLPEFYDNDQKMVDHLNSISTNSTFNLTEVGPQKIKAAKKIHSRENIRIVSYYIRTNSGVILIYSQSPGSSHEEIFEKMIETIQINSD